MRKLVARSAAAVLLAAAVTPGVAAANYTGYFEGYIGTGVANRKSDVTRSQLTSSGVDSYCDGCQIWAGAHYAGGNSLYANWATGSGYACHNYGTSNIGAMIEAPYVAQNIFLAIAGWTGSNGSWYC